MQVPRTKKETGKGSTVHLTIGEVEETIARHNVNGSSQDVKLTTNYSYDHQGRMLTEKVKVDDNGDEITTVANKYNELGELVKKYLHGNSTAHYFNQALKKNSKSEVSRYYLAITQAYLKQYDQARTNYQWLVCQHRKNKLVVLTHKCPQRPW